jgi:hypothetical protein
MTRRGCRQRSRKSAHPFHGRRGEICVSRVIRNNLRHRSGTVFEDLGEQLVKNIAYPVRAFRLREQDDAGGSGIARLRRSSHQRSMWSLKRSWSWSDALELALWESVRDGSVGELETYCVTRRQDQACAAAHALGRPPVRSAAKVLDLASGIRSRQQPPRGIGGVPETASEWTLR